ncbi:tyrosine-type recombinase/integrase [Bacillus sp. Bva_UNVM-123]|uniref:tyrosine-type recombinase/integrase n=1 Tax=Bacillus sp. Bva_UNVM-123 TaxID=2829798 RepID=UPI00391EFC7F
MAQFICNNHFRHSFTTLMSESGSSITSIMQLINHSNLYSTSIYIKSNYTRNQNIKVTQNDILFKKLNEMNLI